MDGALVEGRCAEQDFSFSKHVRIKGGGARAEGGGATAGTVIQQNVAQEGRQNVNCANPNDTDITVTGSRSEVGCQLVDHSANLGTAEIGGGARAEGGSSTAALFQQNVAQEGRQNVSCGNPNKLTLTTLESTSTTQCVAVDDFRNIGSRSR
ncbi:hypothetical protein [Streptomyces sp. NPDC051776]|uniref:hypothetical protein n=1 Tax=Streptomyces sp. NPDC051776 TaxID=3155414 RepID=UPI0034312494